MPWKAYDAPRSTYSNKILFFFFFFFLRGSPCVLLHTRDDGEIIVAGCTCVCQIKEQLQSSCKNVSKSCSTKYTPLLISTAANKIIFFNGVWHDSLCIEGEMAWTGVMSSMLHYYVCPHACVCDPSQTRGGERSHSLSPWPGRQAHWSSAKQ